MMGLSAKEKKMHGVYTPGKKYLSQKVSVAVSSLAKILLVNGLVSRIYLNLLLVSNSSCLSSICFMKGYGLFFFFKGKGLLNQKTPDRGYWKEREKYHPSTNCITKTMINEQKQKFKGHNSRMAFLLAGTKIVKEADRG